YHYARRQWHLLDDPDLKYKFLGEFDRDMIAMARTCKILESSYMNLLYEHDHDKIIAFERAGIIFVFNFHPSRSWTDYRIPSIPGQYRMILNSDDKKFGGYGRLTADQLHFTISGETESDQSNFLSLYIPSRTGIILQQI
ncbi:MAG: alpha amylase C-terminal domain-containing protein, partial [Deltaproteobacteria bacterium]|nr:alpha amylase C-terminal domain-containing protein [Deltaproteobacteria bacterium]